MVTEVLAALDEVRAPPHIERGRPLDVIRHLGAIEPTGYDPGVDAILEEFLRIAPWLPWRQTAGHLGVLRADYLDNYGYVQLIGPPPTLLLYCWTGDVVSDAVLVNSSNSSSSG